MSDLPDDDAGHDDDWIDPPQPGPAPADQRGEPHTPHRYGPLEPVYVDATQAVVIYDWADRPTTVIDGECQDCDSADLGRDIPDAAPPPPGADPWDGWTQLGYTEDGGQLSWHAPLSDAARIDLGTGELFVDKVRKAMDGGQMTTTGGRSSTMSFRMGEISAENLHMALTGVQLWTVGDALQFLDPTPPRRTVARWLAGLQPIGVRALKQGGKPARTYLADEIMKRHARWARTYHGTSGG